MSGIYICWISFAFAVLNCVFALANANMQGFTGWFVAGLMTFRVIGLLEEKEGL